MNKQTFIIDETGEGMRLDKFLTGQLPDFSRSQIQRMEKNFDNSHKLKIGEVIEVVLPQAEQPSSLLLTSGQAAQISPTTCMRSGGAGCGVSILYEDADVIAVDKPRGMVMYPAAGNKTGTLVQELLKYTSLSALGGGVRPGVVHRIDKDTSGVVILAKTDAAFRALIKTFSEHRLTRKYIAFAWGVPTWIEADIEGNIARNSRNRQKMSMVKTGGRPARTEVRVTDVWTRAGVSELKCALFTGRTHQIRVHLSAHGLPILTDPTYGRGKESKIKPGPLLDFLRNHSGQCLHAEVLELKHPTTGEILKLRAPLPPDLAELREELDNY